MLGGLIYGGRSASWNNIDSIELFRRLQKGVYKGEHTYITRVLEYPPGTALHSNEVILMKQYKCSS